LNLRELVDRGASHIDRNAAVLLVVLLVVP
jgi:hypothetical protein